MLSSKRRATPRSIIPDTNIHLVRAPHVEIAHVSTYLQRTYCKEQYTHYTICLFKETPFKVRSMNNSRVEDSIVIYSDGFNNFHPAIITGIIRLKATGSILFFVDEANFGGHGPLVLNGNEYINELFIYATLPSPPSTISIHYNLITEEIAYRVDDNLNSLYEFHAFPNILESIELLFSVYKVLFFFK